jgi:hypothetical protein
LEYLCTSVKYLLPTFSRVYWQHESLKRYTTHLVPRGRLNYVCINLTCTACDWRLLLAFDLLQLTNCIIFIRFLIFVPPSVINANTSVFCPPVTIPTVPVTLIVNLLASTVPHDLSSCVGETSACPEDVIPT